MTHKTNWGLIKPRGKKQFLFSYDCAVCKSGTHLERVWLGNKPIKRKMGLRDGNGEGKTERGRESENII